MLLTYAVASPVLWVKPHKTALDLNSVKHKRLGWNDETTTFFNNC